MARPVQRPAAPHSPGAPVATIPAAAPFVLAALLTLAVAPIATAKGGRDEPHPRSVGVIEGKVYSQPDRREAPIAVLGYGTAVKVLDAAGPPDLLVPWERVRPTEAEGGKAVEGWMLASTLEHQKLVLEAMKKRRWKKASEQEQALAGRSFEDEVERRLKQKKPELARALQILDRVLAASPDDTTADLAAFRAGGVLAPLAETPAELGLVVDGSDGGSER